MGEYKEMTNNQIMGELLSLQEEHKAIKQRILNELDKLDRAEKKFNDASNVLNERIKGKK